MVFQRNNAARRLQFSGVGAICGSREYSSAPYVRLCRTCPQIRAHPRCRPYDNMRGLDH